MSAAKQSTILKYLSMGLLLHSTKCGIPRNNILFIRFYLADNRKRIMYMYIIISS